MALISRVIPPLSAVVSKSPNEYLAFISGGNWTGDVDSSTWSRVRTANDALVANIYLGYFPDNPDEVCDFRFDFKFYGTRIPTNASHIKLFDKQFFLLQKAGAVETCQVNLHPHPEVLAEFHMDTYMTFHIIQRQGKYCRVFLSPAGTYPETLIYSDNLGAGESGNSLRMRKGSSTGHNIYLQTFHTLAYGRLH